MRIHRAFTAITVCIALTLGSVTRVRADGKTLVGNVDPDRDEDREEWGEVQVSAILESDGSVVGSQPSLGSIYIFQANEDTVLSFIFNKAFYSSKRSHSVNVKIDLRHTY